MFKISELKQCPFCGGELQHVQFGYFYNHENGIECSNCRILITSSNGKFTNEELEQKVNLRIPMERILQRLENECKKSDRLIYAHDAYNKAIEYVLKEEKWQTVINELNI